MSDELSNAEVEERLNALQQCVDKLTITNRALWEIVADAHGYDEGKFEAKIAEIDLRDGSLDGKLEGDHPRFK